MDVAAFREIPDWALFTATVDGEPYAFDLRDVAQKFEYRRRKGMDIVTINPVTLKPFNARTLNRMRSRLDALTEAGLLSRELRVGWTP